MEKSSEFAVSLRGYKETFKMKGVILVFVVLMVASMDARRGEGCLNGCATNQVTCFHNGAICTGIAGCATCQSNYHSCRKVCLLKKREFMSSLFQDDDKYDD
ncbi:hypothetical protein OS493_008350 [Desmophyllum pertusum]|uniref:Uncharacterized protein n=1 Tax=Desmophyllum pertusum TaxID=174260 RepID=A0A9X0A7P6_9CNID|nr:hypothetical protein OS493_008350 [Desmophyllum pertusum]